MSKVSELKQTGQMANASSMQKAVSEKFQERKRQKENEV